MELDIDDAIVERVAYKLQRRHKQGMHTFLTTMDDKVKPLEAWLVDTQEELMDAVCYIEKAVDQINQLKRELKELQEELKELREAQASG